MTTAIEYALMAGRAYYGTRADKNRFPIPAGWEGLKHESDPNSGFEVISFVPIGATLTTSTNIVISYAGTGPGWGDWLHGNIPLAGGTLSDQLRQAADYYLQVKASAPAGATITFTGHSLGGGLASLMAVLFGESAFTFDQAPFRSAALPSNLYDQDGNCIYHSAAKDLRDYLAANSAGIDPAKLA